jgi:HEAT repeat protein
MEIPAKKFAKLLESTAPAVRASAAVVAGELGAKDTEIAAGVLALLADESPAVRLEAVRAAGKLKLDKALPALLDKIGHGGPEGDAAAKAAATIGPKGVKALYDLLHKVVPGVRKYIAAALAEADTAGADEAGVAVFREADASVAEAAAQAIIARIPQMTDAKKAGLAGELVKLATAKKPPLPGVAEPAVIRLLAALNVGSTAGFFWERTQLSFPADVRATSLKTVAGWIESPTKDQLKKLLTCAADADFRVVGPALMILDKLPVTAKQADEWKPLFSAPDVGTRRLAVTKLGRFDSAAIADGLVAQLTHHDRGLKDQARAQLLTTNAGRQALVDALLATEQHDDAWGLSRAMAPAAGEFTPKQREAMLAKLGERIEANSHLVDPLLQVLRESDANGLRDSLFEVAVDYRKKKKFDKALPYLRLLGRDPAAGFTLRFELACVGLKMSKRDLGRESRVNDACLSQFAHAANADMDEAIKQLEKAKFLDADDLFYIGFHFAEDLGTLKKFGAAALTQSIKLSPKGKVAANAKSKLKTIVL